MGNDITCYIERLDPNTFQLITHADGGEVACHAVEEKRIPIRLAA